MKDTRRFKLILLMVFTCIYFLTQIIISHITHSLTLLVNSYQMLYNIFCIIGCIVAIKMSNESSLRNTFGWARVEVLSLLASILFLFALCFGAFVESIQTMLHASHQDAMHHPLAVFIIGIVGVLLNLLCFVLIGGYTHAQGCFLHVQGKEVEVSINLTTETPSNKSGDSQQHHVTDFLRDVNGCVIVTICACIVYFCTEPYALFADPLLSILCIFIILGSSFPLVKQSSLILLQNTPDNVDVESLKKRLVEKFPTILNVHDVHVWRLTRDKIIATGHVVFKNSKDYANVNDQVKDFFQNEGISLATIQPEFITVKDGCRLRNTTCVLECGNQKTKCSALQCCPTQIEETPETPETPEIPEIPETPKTPKTEPSNINITTT